MILLFVMTGTCHHSYPLIEMGSCKLYDQTGLEWQSSLFLPLEELGL
jgi:hypothetical protein